MGDYFINPYSFIRIPEKEPERETKEAGNFSGVIECSLEVKSPIFIPNTTNKWEAEEQKGHYKKVFYSYDDLSEKEYSDDIPKPSNPVIPGSEIRGSIRNVYEQLTNSCLSQIDEFNLPYKRTIEPKIMCIMKWNEVKNIWEIFSNLESDKCKAGIIKEIKNSYYFSEGKWSNTGKDETEIAKLFHSVIRKNVNQKKEDLGKIWYNSEIGKIDFNLNKQSQNFKQIQWYIHVPTPMICKKNKATTANRIVVYRADTLTGGSELKESTIKRFEKVLGIDSNIKGGYKDKDTTKYKYNANNIELGRNISNDHYKLVNSYIERYKKHQPLIVYADKNSVDNGFENDVVYLSMSSITKEFFENKIENILENNNQHQPCIKIKKACPACRLFGMISKESNEGAIKGKLRFTDSYSFQDITYGIEKKEKKQEEYTQPVLGSPRISSTEFYLKKPEDGKIWNYDYYTSYGVGENKEVTFIRTPYTPTLAGRKVYLNSQFNKTDSKKTKMNSTITPIIKGNCKFKVFFDDLTETELNNLLFCLALKDKEAHTVHKIGGGKPIGMGQVAITIDKVKKYEYVENNGEITKNSEDYEYELGEIYDSDAAKPILRYSGFDYDTKIIDYPRNEENGYIFKWFANNKGSVIKPEFVNVLPDLMDYDKKEEKLKLKRYTNNTRNNKSTNNKTSNFQNLDLEGKEKPAFDNRKNQSNMLVRTCTVCKKQFKTWYKGTDPKCENCLKSNR